MATDKKHIAVYLDKAVEQALSDFCTANGLESKKGLMYSAAVNKALAQYFQLENPVPGNTSNNTPDSVPGNTSNNTPDSVPGNTSNNTPDNTLALIQQMAEQMTAMEERLGKLSA
ncbi:hypothetical protein QUB33_24485 [Microcoleus sp. B3-A4]|uniref:hypothetical protein n=1 Tax=Microcoleus sp. B3-A4 TaxID=2818653 RepID=UPI002FD6209B